MTSEKVIESISERLTTFRLFLLKMNFMRKRKLDSFLEEKITLNYAKSTKVFYLDSPDLEMVRSSRPEVLHIFRTPFLKNTSERLLQDGVEMVFI